MNKKNLVVLKGKSTLIIQADGTRFEPGKPYRCVPMDETMDGVYIVNGIMFDGPSFNQLFEYLHDVIIREFKTIGLLAADNKPLSKKAFKELASVHQYGRGKGVLNVMYFYTHPKECMYGFYPQFKGDNKATCLENAYKMYLDLLNGEMDEVDNENIQRGNSGIPISYASLRMKPEWNPTDEKLEIYY